jgi:hypothetical protein
MLSDRESFKVGFISRCLEEGFTTPEQIQGQVKKAMDLIGGAEKQADGVLSRLLGMGGSAATVAIPLMLAAPPLAGAAVGYGAARATDIDDVDVEEQKRQEVIDELNRQTAKLRRHKLPSDEESPARVEML